MPTEQRFSCSSKGRTWECLKLSRSFHVPPTGGAALQWLLMTCLSDQINAHDLSLWPSFALVVPSIPVVKRKTMESFFGVGGGEYSYQTVIHYLLF